MLEHVPKQYQYVVHAAQHVNSKWQSRKEQPSALLHPAGRGSEDWQHIGSDVTAPAGC